MELNILNGQIIKDWKKCIYIYIDDLFYDENEIFLTESDKKEVQVFSENGYLLRSWLIMDDFRIARYGYGGGIYVHNNNVFISTARAILTFDRLGNYLFYLTLPYFLIPRMGLYQICIPNDNLYVSGGCNNWIYIFQIPKQKGSK